MSPSPKPWSKSSTNPTPKPHAHGANSHSSRRNRLWESYLAIATVENESCRQRVFDRRWQCIWKRRVRCRNGLRQGWHLQLGVALRTSNNLSCDARTVLQSRPALRANNNVGRHGSLSWARAPASSSQTPTRRPLVTTSPTPLALKHQRRKQNSGEQRLFADTARAECLELAVPLATCPTEALAGTLSPPVHLRVHAHRQGCRAQIPVLALSPPAKHEPIN